MIDTIRAWKDEDYRLSLSKAELAMLPENPAGVTELTEDQMGSLEGGTFLPINFSVTIVLCTEYGSCFSNVTVCPVLTPIR